LGRGNASPGLRRSRHGSTAEIATRIAAILDRSPQIAVVVAAPEVDSLEGFDGYVIGSAVCMGRWLTEARELVHQTDRRVDYPVWLFSSGPIGNPRSRSSKPSTEQTIDVQDVVDATGAR